VPQYGFMWQRRWLELGWLSVCWVTLREEITDERGDEVGYPGHGDCYGDSGSDDSALFREFEILVMLF